MTDNSSANQAVFRVEQTGKHSASVYRRNELIATLGVYGLSGNWYAFPVRRKIKTGWITWRYEVEALHQEALRVINDFITAQNHV